MVTHPFCLLKKITEKIDFFWRVWQIIVPTCVPAVQPKLIKCTNAQAMNPFNGSFPVEKAQNFTPSLAINSKYLGIFRIFIAALCDGKFMVCCVLLQMVLSPCRIIFRSKATQTGPGIICFHPGWRTPSSANVFDSIVGRGSF